MAQQHNAMTVEELREQAQKGDADAQYNLGVRYHTGHEVKQDFDQARHWYEQAAQTNHPNALCNLGILYHNGHGVEQDMEQAARLVMQAAEQGQPNAQLTLGAMYYNGHGVAQDNSRAFECFAQALENGLHDARPRIAFLLREGNDIEKSLISDVKERFIPLAKKGDVNAQFILGEIAYTGAADHDGTPDMEEAAHWYDRAANGGDAHAMVQMANMYQDGAGVEQNEHKAIVMLGRAAMAGDDNALQDFAKYASNLNEQLHALERDGMLAAAFDPKKKDNYRDVLISMSKLQKTTMDVAQKLANAGLINFETPAPTDWNALH